MAAARQLTLDWDHAPSYAREDFLLAPSHAEALRAIDGWRQWPGGLQALLGPSGAGKTHLGAIWAHDADALVVTGAEIGSFDLSRLAGSPRLFIDDADRVGEAEAELFHALNAVRERGGATLFAARQPPDLWGLKTPDLLSRLRLAPARPAARAGHRADAGGAVQIVRGPADRRRFDGRRLSRPAPRTFDRRRARGRGDARPRSLGPGPQADARAGRQGASAG